MYQTLVIRLDTAIDRQIARQPEHCFITILYMEPNKLKNHKWA